MAAADEDEWPDDAEPSAHGVSEVSLQIAPVDGGGAQRDIMVSVQVPDDGARAPADVCCVVDISGSMRTKATYEVDGAVKDDGLTYLDIVKHAVKTVMHMLKDQDRLALVAFDDRVETVFPLGVMTDRERPLAIAALDELVPRGQTNLWGGVLAGMEALREADGGGAAGPRHKTLLVLTDGQPNLSPPRGHLAELKDYKESHPDFRFQLNTFGFGYSLDSETLLQLAVEGQGTYAFIPDAVIVGTVFVNTIANALAVRTQNATLHLTPKGGAALAGPATGGYSSTEAPWGRVIEFGPLQSGQSRQLVVQVSVPEGDAPYLEAAVVYLTADGATHRVTAQATARTPSADTVAAAARSDAVTVALKAIEDGCANRGKSAVQNVQALVGRIAARQSASSDASVASLQADIEGRVSKALKGKERFNRWGKHYLRALVRAHQVQQCTNFMDPGLQGYGGSLFRQLRQEGDQIFLSLPPPKPSLSPASNCAPRRVNPPAPAAHQAQAAPAAKAKAAPAQRPRSPSPVRRCASPDMNVYYGGGGGG